MGCVSDTFSNPSRSPRAGSEFRCRRSPSSSPSLFQELSQRVPRSPVQPRGRQSAHPPPSSGLAAFEGPPGCSPRLRFASGSSAPFKVPLLPPSPLPPRLPRRWDCRRFPCWSRSTCRLLACGRQTAFRATGTPKGSRCCGQGPSRREGGCTRAGREPRPRCRQDKERGSARPRRVLTAAESSGTGSWSRIPKAHVWRR